MINVLGVIPARMGSSRFPGKPLKLIGGKPMLWHCWQRAKLSGVLDELVIAACDSEIKEAAESFGAKVVMTSSLHTRANDRVAEVASKIPCNIILNIQGDEPLLNPQLVRDVVVAAKERNPMTCLCPVVKIKTQEDLNSPNTVKVVFAPDGKIIYFSRCPIPSDAVVKRNVPVYQQVPIMVFDSLFCQKLSSLSEGPLEVQEGIDLIRALENDLSIYAMKTDFESIAVDVPRDLEVVEERIKSDPVYAQYRNNSCLKV